jgi:hypothetical protein
LSRFYANITLKGPAAADVVDYLRKQNESAYVSPAVRDAIVVFHEDMQNQESLAGGLSAQFSCPVLLVMAFAETILLYHLYENGVQTDAYVSSPHADLELEVAPPGDAAVLCAAFEADRFQRRVESILRKETKSDHPFANAINRHGELFGALGLPQFAAGASFQSIEIGEIPMGKGFDVEEMVRTK